MYIRFSCAVHRFVEDTLMRSMYSLLVFELAEASEGLVCHQHAPVQSGEKLKKCVNTSTHNVAALRQINCTVCCVDCFKCTEWTGRRVAGEVLSTQ